MRRFVSYLLIAGFLFNTGGGYFIFHTLQAIHRTRTERAIDHGETDQTPVILTPDLNDDLLEWIKPGREFRLNGELYDVVQLTSENGHQVIVCIRDPRENNLVNSFKTANKQRKDPEKRVKRTQGPSFCQSCRPVSSIPTRAVRIYQSYIFTYCSTIVQTPAPPPRQS